MSVWVCVCLKVSRNSAHLSKLIYLWIYFILHLFMFNTLCFSCVLFQWNNARLAYVNITFVGVYVIGLTYVYIYINMYANPVYGIWHRRSTSPFVVVVPPPLQHRKKCKSHAVSRNLTWLRTFSVGVVVGPFCFVKRRFVTILTSIDIPLKAWIYPQPRRADECHSERWHMMFFLCLVAVEVLSVSLCLCAKN